MSNYELTLQRSILDALGECEGYHTIDELRTSSNLLLLDDYSEGEINAALRVLEYRGEVSIMEDENEELGYKLTQDSDDSESVGRYGEKRGIRQRSSL